MWDLNQYFYVGTKTVQKRVQQGKNGNQKFHYGIGNCKEKGKSHESTVKAGHAGVGTAEVGK